MKRKVLLVTIALAIVALVLAAERRAAADLTAWLQSAPRAEHPRWSARNAIIVLGAGTVRWPDGSVQTHPLGIPRVAEALRLYRDCRGDGNHICLIVPTGGDPRGRGVSEARTMARELEELGAARTDLLLEERSENTFRNAQLTRELLDRHPVDHVVLVTSGLHLHRAAIYFRFFGHAFEGAPADRFPDAAPWTLLGPELVGLARFHLYNLMGWNPKSPGAAAQ